MVGSTPKISSNKFAQKTVLMLAAVAIALGIGAPAFAGGGHFNSGYYGGYGGYYSSGFHGNRGHFRGHRGHFRGGRRHHRGGHGGKGAAIALGVIGGAILLSEVARADERRRYQEERYYRRYDQRYDRYQRRQYDSRFENGDIEDRAREDAENADDAIDRSLEGGAATDGAKQRNDGGPAPITISYRGAYDACKTHARKALGNRGFHLEAPAKPETAEDMGRAYRMTATVTAINDRGERWRRAMYCEASESRVYLLELI